MPFSPEERAHLLAAPQIGPRLLDRLEGAGFESIAQMQRAGVEVVMRAVCDHSGHLALTNRARAISRALAAAVVRAA